MVLVIDDTLLLPIAMLDQNEALPVITPNIYMMIFNTLRKHALEEMYPVDKIQGLITENRMEYEFGEISKKEYEERNNELMERLRVAKKVREMEFKGRVDILNA